MTEVKEVDYNKSIKEVCRFGDLSQFFSIYVYMRRPSELYQNQELFLFDEA